MKYSNRSRAVFLAKAIYLVSFLILTVFIYNFHFTSPAFAVAVPQLSYQGKLADATGNGVANGIYAITFSIYQTESGGSTLWQETQNISVKNGVVSAVLGSGTALNLDFNSGTYYLGIKVGDDTEMTPRRQIGAAPYAFNSQKLNGLEAGVGTNNILQLGSSGQIDIVGEIKTTNNLIAGASMLDSLTVKTGFTVQGGNISLPVGSIETTDLADDVVTADKLYVAAINSDGKLTALTSAYVANLDGSNLTGVVATGIADGSITNAKVSSTAAVAYSKLNLVSSIQGSDLATNIAIFTSGTANFSGIFQLSGVTLTSTVTELNLLDGVTTTTAELNILDGVTATTAELNVLDGITPTVTELNYVDGVTSAIQTQLAARLPLSGGVMAGNIAMGDNSITGIDTLTFTDTAGTIAGIQNQNLLDKTDTETVSGTWSFTGQDSFVNFVAATGGQVVSISQNTADAAGAERSVLRLTTLGIGAEDYLIQGYGFGGSTFSVRADGGLRATYTNLVSSDTTVLTVNNSTGVNDIVRFQDNGASVFTIANGGTITATGDAWYTNTARYDYTATGLVNVVTLNVTDQTNNAVNGLVIGQNNGSTNPLSTGLSISNNDTNTAITAGISIQDIAGGGITTGVDINGAGTAIDISDAAIGTGISLGVNDILGNAVSITSTGLSVGGGSTISGHRSQPISNQVSNNIPANSCANYMNIVVDGAQAGDTVIASPDATSSADGIEDNNLIWSALVSAPNTVTIRACNPTGADINTADDQEWRADVWQH